MGTEVADTRTDREQVLDVVQGVFDYLAERDGEGMKTLFWPGAMLVSDREGYTRKTALWSIFAISSIGVSRKRSS